MGTWNAKPKNAQDGPEVYHHGSATNNEKVMDPQGLPQDPENEEEPLVRSIPGRGNTTCKDPVEGKSLVSGARVAGTCARGMGERQVRLDRARCRSGLTRPILQEVPGFLLRVVTDCY